MSGIDNDFDSGALLINTSLWRLVAFCVFFTDFLASNDDAKTKNKTVCRSIPVRCTQRFRLITAGRCLRLAGRPVVFRTSDVKLFWQTTETLVGEPKLASPLELPLGRFRADRPPRKRPLQRPVTYATAPALYCLRYVAGSSIFFTRDEIKN